jgi:hypothetical protein
VQHVIEFGPEIGQFVRVLICSKIANVSVSGETTGSSGTGPLGLNCARVVGIVFEIGESQLVNLGRDVVCLEICSRVPASIDQCLVVHSRAENLWEVSDTYNYY